MNDPPREETCPIPNRDEDEQVREVLSRPQTIAVVGMSPNSERPSHEVGVYLRQHGYTVIPIHPKAKEIDGLKVYANLSAIPAANRPVSLVALFVAGDRTGPIIEQAAQIGAQVVYFQPGAENEMSEALARRLGLQVFAGRCVMADHIRLLRR